MGEFKGFMKYDKQSLSELSLVDRLSNHKRFNNASLKKMLRFRVLAVWIVEHLFVKLGNLMEEKQ